MNGGTLRGGGREPALVALGGGPLAIAVGIDPSLTRLALAVAGDAEETVAFAARSLSGVPRLLTLRDRTLEWIERWRPAIVVMEGYSMASRAGRLADLGELGGVLKVALWEADYREEHGTLVVVPPPQLKKFVVGRGNAEKAAMIAAVVRRWNVDISTDDEADAYGLARLGVALLGAGEPLTVYQEDVVRKIRAKLPVALG